MSPLRLTVPVGTRPEVIKLAPVVHALRAAGHEVRCIATGQHYDARMYGDVFAGFGLVPDDIWTLQGSEGERLGQLMTAAFAELSAHPADAVLVLGDTYTAPLVAIAARRYGIGVIHLEAGLRSQNGLSVEEVNRKMMVGLATVHLAPTPMAAAFLAGEAVSSDWSASSATPSWTPSWPWASRYGHWPSAAGSCSRPTGPPTSTPPHAWPSWSPWSRDWPPRMVRCSSRCTRAPATGWSPPAGSTTCSRPTPSTSSSRSRTPRLLTALSTSTIAVTDSGGLQEEAAYFGVPAVVMRNSTPRWEGVAAGTTVLTGMSSTVSSRRPPG